MSEGPQNQENQEKSRSNKESWDEVGKQFQTLGESLATAFRTAWQDESNRKKVEEMKIGLQSLVKEVGKAIDESATSERGQKLIHEAERAADSLHKAGVETVQEVQPHLLTALRQVSLELQKLIERIEKDEKKPDASEES
jgi:hypothetical protein